MSKGQDQINEGATTPNFDHYKKGATTPKIIKRPDSRPQNSPSNDKGSNKK